MRKMIIRPIIAGVLTLGLALPALADDAEHDVAVTTVQSRVCYDSDGDRVPCRGTRYYRYDRDYRVYEPGIRFEFGTGDRRYRYRDRYWD
ncbi:MAG: hypothetical protein ACKVP3_19755 [Hyphomicrobiaceae bacterium]